MLYMCHTADWTQWFVSSSPTCDGFVLSGELGYVARDDGALCETTQLYYMLHPTSHTQFLATSVEEREELETTWGFDWIESASTYAWNYE